MDQVPPPLADALRDRYRLERELGQGGMATVYLARDLKHDRLVAVKVLRPELNASLGPERFLREIRVTAGLQHPHILLLHDSGLLPDSAGDTEGRPYYVMAYVDGESLRERLARERQLGVQEAISIARQIAAALQYAHEQGVVHRDIKPENILLTRHGDALVADFGVARAIRAGNDRLTATGLALGTPSYMAPEQASGADDVDGRADIYALGCLLYEMLAGEPPYTGPSAQAIIGKRLAAPIPSVRHSRAEIPEAIDAVIRRSLAKAPADRYASARDLDTALEQGVTGRRRRAPGHAALVAAGLVLVAGYAAWQSRARGVPPADAAVSAPRLAVLPFENLAAPDREHFADGVTDELTTRLSRLSGLVVIARASSAQYKRTTRTLREIGDELGVQYVLQGSVRWEDTPNGGSRIRVSPQLVRVADASHLWSEPYETRLTGVFDVQAAIAERVAAALDVTLLEPERTRLHQRPTASLAAYDAFLRGNSSLFRSYADSNVSAGIALYQRAVDLDSAFALAWARLSQARSLHFFLHDPSPEQLTNAQTAADRALALAPALAEASLAQGLIHYRGNRDYVKALEQFSRGLEQEPNNPAILAARGWVERRMGRFEQSNATLLHALERNPRAATLLFDLGQNYALLRRYDEADRFFSRAAALAPEYPDVYAERMLAALAATGSVEMARRHSREAASQLGADAFVGGLNRWLCLLVCGALDSASRMVFDRLPPPGVDPDSGLGMGRDEAGSASSRHLRLAQAYLVRKRADSAAHHAREAAAADSLAGDHFAWPLIATVAAQILAKAGAPEEASARLEYLLTIPSPVSGCLIRTDPWTSLLGDVPRFQRLLARSPCPGASGNVASSSPSGETAR